MRPQGWVGGSRHDEDGEAPPLPPSDGLVRLRRRSDWSEEPRPGDEAAEAAYRAALAMATATLAEHDGGTASHSDDVVTLTLALAEELGVEGRDRAYLLAAAELHDIGKIAVPPQILSKPAPLDEEEWEAIREHTVTGERILGAVPELGEVARIVRHCHERWDGEGYPDGLNGTEIPLPARIVFCADAFHAIRGDRPYRRGRSARAALSEVKKHAGTQFDPEVVTALVRVAASLRQRRTLGVVPMFAGRRSQRLAALLLTLAIGGSAFAATGVWHPTRGKASADVDEPVPAEKPRDAGPTRDAVADHRPQRPAREKTSSQPRQAAGAADDEAIAPAARLGGRTVAEPNSESVSRTPPRVKAPKPRRAPTPVGRSPHSKRAPTRPRPAPRVPAPAPAPQPTLVPTPTPTPTPTPVPPPASPDDEVEDDDDRGHGGNGNGHQGHGNGHQGHDD